MTLSTSDLQKLVAALKSDWCGGKWPRLFLALHALGLLGVLGAVLAGARGWR